MLEIKQGQNNVTRIVTSNKTTEINIMTHGLGRCEAESIFFPHAPLMGPAGSY